MNIWVLALRDKVNESAVKTASATKHTFTM